MEITVPNESMWTMAVETLWEEGKGSRIWTLKGDLGSGKTTFVRNLVAHLGGPDIVSSPTFAIVNEYTWDRKSKPLKIYHLDLYRLESIEELLDIGFEELVDDGDLILIEWPDIAEPLMDDAEVFRLLFKSVDNHRIVLAL